MLMNDKGFGGRVLRWLGSLRLSVVVMVTIGSICAFTARHAQAATIAAQPAL